MTWYWPTRLLVVLVVIVNLLACIDEFAISGAPCPCPQGYRCCPQDQVCAKEPDGAGGASYIFHDALPACASFQGDPISIVAANSFVGTTALQLEGQNRWANYRIVNLNVDAVDLDWANAGLEFALKSSTATAYVSLNLWGDDVQAAEQSVSLAGSDTYEPFCIALRDFSATHASFGDAVTQFMIGSTFGSGSVVYLDEVRITRANADCLE
jgi:hypothetical protein